MKEFRLHTMDSAPEGSKPFFENSIKNYGSLPNLHAIFGEEPAALDAYQQLHSLFQQTDFNAEELTVIWQTINVAHGCAYCVPAHSLVASVMGVAPALNDALRNGDPMPTPKLQVLHDTTLAILRERGQVDDAVLERFYDAGYEQKHILGILLGMAQKVMSNYINHIAKTPLDEMFQPFAK